MINLPGEWLQQAACNTGTGELVNVFIFENEQELIRETDKVMRALGYCASCNVQTQCLDYGMATNKNNYAIYGGEIITPKRRIYGKTIELREAG